MKSKKYIDDKLHELVEKFPEVTLQYEFDELNETHIVEVLPQSVYDKNNLYKEAEGDLTFEFDQMFFPEEIMFVSEDSLTRVKKPQKTFKAESFSFCEKFEMTESEVFNFSTNMKIGKMVSEKSHRAYEDNFALAA
jgi:hypothetical protein